MKSVLFLTDPIWLHHTVKIIIARISYVHIKGLEHVEFIKYNISFIEVLDENRFLIIKGL